MKKVINNLLIMFAIVVLPFSPVYGAKVNNYFNINPPAVPVVATAATFVAIAANLRAELARERARWVIASTVVGSAIGTMIGSFLGGGNGVAANQGGAIGAVAGGVAFVGIVGVMALQ
jgi:uncharacterized protein YcfJ